MTTLNLIRRVGALELAATAHTAVRVLSRPADMAGDALAVWEAEHLNVPHAAAMTVIILRFG